MKFETEINGISCICNVTHYDPGTSYGINSASLDDNDPEEFYFELLTLDGEQCAELDKLAERDDVMCQMLEEFKELSE